MSLQHTQDKLMAYCGLNCGKCSAYIATQNNDKEGLAKTAAQWSERFKVKIKPADVICDGCATSGKRKASYCAMCEIRICCVEKGKKNCALCGEYICEKLGKFFKQAPEAKENLERVIEKKS